MKRYKIKIDRKNECLVLIDKYDLKVVARSYGFKCLYTFINTLGIEKKDIQMIIDYNDLFKYFVDETSLGGAENV